MLGRSIAAALLCLSLLSPAGAAAYCRLTTEMPVPGEVCAEGGTGLFWERQCISYTLVPRAQGEPPLEDLRAAVDRSFGTWADVSCGGEPLALSVRQTTNVGSCDKPEYNSTGPNANSIMFLNDWAERGLEPRAFGLTLVWHDPRSGRIYDADMQINETLGDLTICDQVRCAGQVDVENVVTHEAGHFLGLGHSTVAGAAMSSRAAIGETTKRELGDDDREGVCSIYGDYTAPECVASDYTPDRGWVAACWDPPKGWCAVGGVGQRGPAPAWLSLAFLGALMLLVSRVRASSSRPRARKR